MCFLSRFLLGLILRPRVFSCICLGIFLEVGLNIRVNSEVGKQSLISSCLGFSDVGHLDSFFTKLPLIPAVAWIDIFLNKMNRSLNSFIDHQLVFDTALDSLTHKAQLDLNSLLGTFLKASSRRRK